jgi:hypothetical protein
VASGLSGVFFEQQTVEDIASAVEGLSTIEINSCQIVAHAKKFSRDQFLQKMHAHIDRLLVQKRRVPFAANLQAEPSDIAMLRS